MSHSKELLDKIATLLQRDYPQETHKYVFEKSLCGTRMYPDIQIRKKDGGRLCCLVEIGYTRPEKLTAYRMEYGVKDVRWYAKDGELHTAWEEKSVRVSIQWAPKGRFFLYALNGTVVENFYCESEFCKEERDSAEDVYEAADIAWTQLSDSIAYVITDWGSAWCVLLCDFCGAYYLLEDELEIADVLGYLHTKRQRRCTLKENLNAQGTWEEMVSYVYEWTGKRLVFENGFLIADGWPHHTVEKYVVNEKLVSNRK